MQPHCLILVMYESDFAGQFTFFKEPEGISVEYERSLYFAPEPMLIVLGTALATALSTYSTVGSLPLCWDGFEEMLVKQLEIADQQIGEDLRGNE